MTESLFKRMLITLTLLFGAMSGMSAADRLYVESVYIEPGETKTLSLNLDNEVPYYGLQADIMLPKGLEFVVVNESPVITTTSRVNSSYSIVSNLLNLGSLRVGMFSSTHSPISETTGSILTIKVIADDEFVGGVLSLANIHVVGESNQDISLPNYSMSIRNQAINNCYIPDTEIRAGQTKTVSIALDNETPFAAFQTDIYLPNGLSIVADSFKTTTRTASHTISSKGYSDGRTRLACFSTANTVISSGPGAVIEFDIYADGNSEGAYIIELKNQVFSTSSADEYTLPNSSTRVEVVKTLVSEINLNETSIELNEGGSFQLTAMVVPEQAGNKLNWTSSNSDVATVSQDGLVTAISQGTAVITASTTDGSELSATCTITVNTPVSEIVLSKTKLELNEGKSEEIYATVLPSNATNAGVTWTSSDETVATVQDGMVYAHKVGTAIIRVQSIDNPEIYAECEVAVSFEAGIEELTADGIYFTIESLTVNVHGANDDTTIRMFDISGQAIYIGNEHKVVVNKSGVYLLVINGKTFKIITVR